jgi:Domain of unknown function (DUF5655)
MVKSRRTYAEAARPTVRQHFVGRDPIVRAIYDRIVSAAETFGTVEQDPKKTSIHLNRRSAFAGIATRKDGLILTLKAASDIRSPRIIKRDQASANRWHLEIRVKDPKEVDQELTSWLKEAYELAS